MVGDAEWCCEKLDHREDEDLSVARVVVGRSRTGGIYGGISEVLRFFVRSYIIL